MKKSHQHWRYDLENHGVAAADKISNYQFG
jgi:hypothetical protein